MQSAGIAFSIRTEPRVPSFSLPLFHTQQKETIHVTGVLQREGKCEALNKAMTKFYNKTETLKIHIKRTKGLTEFQGSITGSQSVDI